VKDKDGNAKTKTIRDTMKSENEKIRRRWCSVFLMNEDLTYLSEAIMGWNEDGRKIFPSHFRRGDARASYLKLGGSHGCSDAWYRWWTHLVSAAGKGRELENGSKKKYPA
jgi:hypothetical protein